MYLVKFTAKKWQNEALLRRNIRIGSIAYYREIEDLKFKDEDEGEGRTAYKSKTVLTEELFNKIFSDGNIRLTNGWKIDTNGNTFYSERCTFNAFVFSCSLLKRRKDIQTTENLFKSNSHYFIKDIWKFAYGVAEQIRIKVICFIEENPDKAFFDPKEHEKLTVLPVFGKVLYTDENKHRLVTNNNIESFDPFAIGLDNFFKKPKKYASENEFRFMWFLNLGNIDNDEWSLISSYLNFIDISLEDEVVTKKEKSFKKHQITDKEGRQIVF